MEKWDILDANGETVGQKSFSGQTSLKSGEYHLVVHIWIITKDGKFLIQRRSQDKRLMPGEWAATGGSAISCETSFCAAQRELLEELGLRLIPRKSKCVSRIKRRNAFLDIWFALTDEKLEGLRLQPSEVDSVKWVNTAELKEMIENGEFHNYGEEYFNVVLNGAKEFLYEFGN